MSRLTTANIDNKKIKEATIDVNGKRYVYAHRNYIAKIKKYAEKGDIIIYDNRAFGLVKLDTLDRLRRLLHQRGQRGCQT